MRALLLLLLSISVTSFTVTTPRPTTHLHSTNEKVQNNSYLNDLESQNPNLGNVEPQFNPDRPELPAIPGDYDWDAKYAGDDDWVTGNDIPGRRVMNEIELAEQVRALDALEAKWINRRDREMYEDSLNVGWVPRAEIINGRTAMFFLVTGLLTEYWTGLSMPGQVEEMLRIGGFIGFD